MKKISTILISFLLMTFLLGGCGTTDSGQEESTEAPKAEEQLPETHYTENQTEMSNTINRKEACIINGWVYTNGHEEASGDSLFMKMRTDSSDKTILKENVYPYFININGEYIYAVLVDDETQPSIYRFRLGGEDEKKIVDKAFYFSIANDSLYYCKSENCADTEAFCKSDLDGNNEELILDKAIYYPYVIGNKLFYQDDNDNETIHEYDMVSGEDIRLTDSPTYRYVLNDDCIYCLQENKNSDDNLSKVLVKVDLSTKEATTIYEGAGPDGLAIKDDKVFFINRNDDSRIYSIDKSGENIGIVTQDDCCAILGIYDDNLVYEDFNSDYEYIDSLSICNLDGSNKKVLSNAF